AHQHMSRCEVCFDVMPLDIAFGTRAAIFDRQLNGHINVNNDGRQQKQTDCPKQRSEIVQMLRVTVDPIRTQKNLQIAEQMSDNKKNQDDARDCDDHFLSNGRAIKSGENIHDRFGARRSTPHASEIMNVARSVKTAGREHKVSGSEYRCRAAWE